MRRVSLEVYLVTLLSRLQNRFHHLTAKVIWLSDTVRAMILNKFYSCFTWKVTLAICSGRCITFMMV